jgi:integrase
MKLDAATISGLTLKPGETDRIFFDEAIKGFGLRLRANNRIWVFQYRDQDARTRRVKIGDADVMDARKARNKATVMLGRVSDGEDPATEKKNNRRANALTLATVAADYLEMKKLEMQRGKYRASSLRVTELYLTDKRYFGPLHSMGISKIGLADVASCLTAIERKSGAVTFGRARSALSSLFTWAMTEGLMGPNPHNPIAATRKPKDITPRDRVLSDTELAAIWRACGDDDFGRVVKLLTLTGCRKEEIGSLQFSELDLENGLLSLPGDRVKNGHPHQLPLSPLALQIIGTVPVRVGRNDLFGNRTGRFASWGYAKGQLDVRLGNTVKPWRVHDLRRTVATGLAETCETEPHIIEAILNHFSGHRAGTAGIYNRARYIPQMRNALALWADHVRAIVEGTERKILSYRKPA